MDNLNGHHGAPGDHGIPGDLSAPSTPNWPVHAIDEHAHEPERWLWEPRIPFGLVTIMEDERDDVLSRHAVGIAAHLTHGGPLPDGSPLPLGNAVILSAAGLADQIVPWLEHDGAHRSRLTLLGPTPERAIVLPRDITLLAHHVYATGAMLVFIDPLRAFLPSGVMLPPTADVAEQSPGASAAVLERVLTTLDVLAAASGAAVVVCRNVAERWNGWHHILHLVRELP